MNEFRRSTYFLVADEKDRATVERVHQLHAHSCPIYMSLHKAIEITTEYSLVAMKRVIVIGVLSSAAARRIGQDRAPELIQKAGLIDYLTAGGIEVCCTLFTWTILSFVQIKRIHISRICRWSSRLRNESPTRFLLRLPTTQS